VSSEFDVRVLPRSSQEKLEILADGSLKVWVHAAPTDGQANDAVCRLLAEKAGVSKSSVTVVRGGTSRNKRVRIEGLELSEARKRLSF
jgi:uncharacterized protein